jgi:hypothetical protein
MRSLTRSPSSSTASLTDAFLIVLLITLLSACAAPIGVKRVDSKLVQPELSSNILTTGKLSASARNLLRYANLSEDYAKRPY